MHKYTIPIIIPFFRAKEKLDSCITAIEQQSHSAYEIFVRDNSNDNILYTAAINEGLRKYCFNDNYKYVLILSHDAYLQANTLECLLETIESDPQCGICSPIQLSDTNNAVTWGGSLDAFPNGVHLTESLDYYQQDFDTFWANGAAMLVRTSMVREIGLFDENMRFICSDSDYSFTARSRGWSIKVCVRGRIYHSPNSSLQTKNIELEIVKTQDWLYFAKKWLTGGLYKSMAFEGEKLTRMKISTAVEAFKNQILLLHNQAQDK